MKSVITLPIRGSVEFDREAPVIAPPAPTLQSVTPGNAENDLSWTASIGAISYKIFFSTSPGVTTSDTSISLGDVQTFTHSGLANGTTYYYKIQAIGSGGGESALSNELSGTPTAATFDNGFSLSLDGINQYAAMPALKTGPFSKDAGDPFTLSVWVKINALGSEMSIWDARSGTSGEGFILRIRSGGTLYTIYKGSTGGVITKESINSINAGEWVHLTVSKSNSTDASAYNLYVNGALVPTVDNGGTATGSFAQMSTNLLLGADGDDTASSRYWDGFIDEVSFWNTELSQAEIQEIYNSGTPDDLLNHSATGDLVAWWRCGDGDNSIIFDQIGSADFALINSPTYSTDVP